MILADTNVIIDYLKGPTDALVKIFREEDIAICGVVEAELLHGSLSEKDADRLSEAISCFEMLPFGENWNQLGNMLNKLRINGITLPFSDAMIACVAIRHNVPVLTGDKHFKLIANVFPELKMYDM